MPAFSNALMCTNTSVPPLSYKQTASTTTGGSILELKTSATFPTAVSTITGVITFNALMGGGSPKTVLQTLYEVATDNNAYFAAVYLSCVKEDGAVNSTAGFTTGNIPFDAAYVKTQFTNDAIGSLPFFKRICGA